MVVYIIAHFLEISIYNFSLLKAFYSVERYFIRTPTKLKSNYTAALLMKMQNTSAEYVELIKLFTILK